MVCEANSDAGSETQGCRQSNAGNGIETKCYKTTHKRMYSEVADNLMPVTVLKPVLKVVFVSSIISLQTI